MVHSQLTRIQRGETMRAQLEPHLQKVREYLPEVLKVLEKNKNQYYASVFVENRHKRSFQANQKLHSKTSNIQEGCVLQIYDGHTLHESATNDLGKENLLALAKELLQQVETREKPSSAPRYYKAASWKERLKEDLDSEIKDQIGQNPGPETQVHFGIFQKEALWKEEAQAMEHVNTCLRKLQSYSESLPEGDPAKNPDLYQVHMQLKKEDSIFIDREVNMSQSIPRNIFQVHLIKNKQLGYESNGGIGGMECVAYDKDFLEDIFTHLRKCLLAERIKPGRYKILMGPDVTGVFAHEAFGHSQEGDTCARERSKAWELYKSQIPVGNKHATILNNPAIYKNAHHSYGAWGSYYFDEEGWLAHKQYLVREGLLQEPMTNLTSALRLQVPRTANGKREAWSHGVYTRQTNTYFSQGEDTFEDMLKSVDYGFLAIYPHGGMEDPKGMGIQVGITVLEEIKDGELTGKYFRGPKGGAIQMTGYTPDYLNSIEKKSKIDAHIIEKDSSKHPLNKPGGCGKYHKEIVDAGSGGPFLLVNNVLVG